MSDVPHDSTNTATETSSPVLIPTRDELRALARYWEEEALLVELCWFQTGCVGGSEARLRALAGQRVSLIADVLGKEAVREEIGRVREEYRRRDPRAWDIFENGSQEEQLAYQEEWYERLPDREEERR